MDLRKGLRKGTQAADAGGASRPAPCRKGIHVPKGNHNGMKADEVAIIGMCGRFPGATDIDEFWENLRDGVESIVTFSPQELAEAGVDPAVLANPDVRACGQRT